MRKVVWRGLNQLDVVEDRQEPPGSLPAGHVLVRVAAAGVCSTDLHIIEGIVSFVPPPLVLGHEFCGRVEACGEQVTKVRPGDRVKCDSVVGCGVCAWCRRGAVQFCPTGYEYGITHDGAWTDWLVVPERNLHLLPDAISDEEAAILDPEVYGPLRKAGVQVGDTVVVFGPGFAGLVATQLAKLMGAARVILCGTRVERLACGARLGADHTIDVKEQDAIQAIHELTGGRGADLVFEAAGVAASACQAVEVVRPQGKVIYYGVHGRKLDAFPIDAVVLKDLLVYGAVTDRVGWEDMIALVAAGKVNLKSIITHRFPLESAGEAYTIVRDRKQAAIKAVLRIGAA